jgi:phosphoenolpyruvate-protein phosphotransferase
VTSRRAPDRVSPLQLRAPLRGWCASLDEAPDPVFKERMLGDGVLIDPTGDTLHAPCDGEVTSIAGTKHSVTIRAANGAEILLHVGIDTVALGGEGFRAVVEAGARVRSGDPLLHFDLDVLARRAQSLVTPIVVTNGEQFKIARMECGRSVDVGDLLLELRGVDAGAIHGAASSSSAITKKLVVSLEHGIHARPAAQIAQLAKRAAAQLTVEAHGKTADARSAVALMALGARCGDEIAVHATGVHAEAAIRDLAKLMLELSRAIPPARRTAAPSASSSALRADSPPDSGSDGRRLRGVIASRGFAVGRSVTLGAAAIEVVEAGRGIAHESEELDRARAAVRSSLERLALAALPPARDVVDAHLEFLEDPELIAAARRSISRGKSAAFAWRQAIRESADALRALDDALMTERVADLLDIESQVLQALGGSARTSAGDLPERSILIAHDLKPSQLIALDARKVAGICMAAGGPTSHAAILAAAIGLPALVALGDAALAIEDGTWIVLDAEQGHLVIAPDQESLASAERAVSARELRREAERAVAHADCRTLDGARIEVLANLSSLAEAQVAAKYGADGCGLLRTEFLFLDRDSPPDEEEQTRQYQSIAHALSGRPLTIRTLDVGGDKPIAYLPLPAEANPALGLRGVRTSLWRPDLTRVQLRAILRVEPADQCRVLLPMITDGAEIKAVRRMLDEARRDIGVDGAVAIGAMIETPAAALGAERIAREVDFFSIGTNDLTQYALAMDRGHPDLAARIDALHPAVLRLIAMTVDAAAAHSRPVAVCGGLASDPAAVPLLIGLGVRELSVVPSLIPQLKALIRKLTLDDCRSLAREALAAATAEEVRGLVNDFSAFEPEVTS